MVQVIISLPYLYLQAQGRAGQGRAPGLGKILMMIENIWSAFPPFWALGTHLSHMMILDPRFPFSQMNLIKATWLQRARIVI